MATKILEGIVEGSVQPPHEDAYTKKVASGGNYEMYVDSRERKVMIYMTDYHGGTLEITREGLETMLNLLK